MNDLKNIFSRNSLVQNCLVLLLACLFLPLINSCHKYPEDPFISFKKPWKRLEGTWQFTGYKINGVDHNHDFDSFLAPKTLTDCNITFSSYYDLKGWYIIKDNNGNGVRQISVDLTIYGFDDDRSYKNLTITGDTSGFYSQLWKGNKSGYAATASIWKIEELYSKKLHLTKNGIDIYFKKQ